jgi:putative hemolysin
MTTFGLLAVLLLVLANGFFVATEFAIVAVRRSRIDQLAAERGGAALAAQEVIHHLDAYIAACQLGITLASLALGWVGEPALAHLVEPAFAAFPGVLSAAASHGLSTAVAFGIITALHIVAGELAPKGIALQKPEETALLVARPLRVFYTFFRWPTTLLNTVGNGFLKLIGFQVASGHEMVHSVEELRFLVSASQKAGAVEESEARIASRAFAFADRTAGELMTPRPDLVAIAVTASRPEITQAFYTHRYQRLPVYEGSLDNIVGVVRVHDILEAGGDWDLRRRIRPVHAVPSTKAADDLLEEMRAARDHAAVVVDEFGATAGFITLHDLVEGLLGRIDEGPGAPSTGQLEPDGSRTLDALVRLSELEEAVGIVVSEEEAAHADTLSGFAMAQLGRVPKVGDEIVLGGRRLRVEKLRGRRADVLRLLPAAPASGPPIP